MDLLDSEIEGWVKELLMSGRNDIYDTVSNAYRQHVIRLVLKYCDGNEVEACNRLGISRMTLRRKICKAQ